MNKNIPKEKRSPLKKRQLRVPGQSLEEAAADIQRNIAIHYLLSGVFIVFALSQWWQWYRNLPPNPAFFGVIALAFTVYSFVRIRK